MKVIDSLKLNKFKNVSVPRNRDLYARVGGRVPGINNEGFTSEYGKDKLQLLADSESALTQEMIEAQKQLDAQDWKNQKSNT